MTTTGFISTFSTRVLRACANKVQVDTVTERAASLTWIASTSSPFTVFYAPVGSKFRSKRVVAHPKVHLHNLRPGSKYNVQITADDFNSNTSFTTTAIAESTTEQDTPQLPLTELSRLEIRVGKIIQCERHPDADTLYVEKVDVGEEEPRTIVSGLVKYIELDEMIDRDVLVLCNLKPRAMRGVTSQGMLLCASNEDHSQVDPLKAPDGAPIGELILFDGHKSEPIDAGNRATKAFDRVVDGLRTDEQGVALFEDTPFSTSLGPCISPNKLVGSIS